MKTNKTDPLNPSEMQATRLVSRVCQTKEEALQITPLLQINFLESPSLVPESRTEISKKAFALRRGREGLRTSARGRFIRERTGALNEAQQKDADKTKKY